MEEITLVAAVLGVGLSVLTYTIGRTTGQRERKRSQADWHTVAQRCREALELMNKSHTRCRESNHTLRATAGLLQVCQEELRQCRIDGK